MKCCPCFLLLVLLLTPCEGQSCSQQHKLWAYRLAGLGLGTLFVRMGGWALILLLSAIDDSIDLAHSPVYKTGLNVLISTNHIPFILIAGHVCKLEQQQLASVTFHLFPEP